MVDLRKLILSAALIPLWLLPNIIFGQQVKNVPQAFKALQSEPKVILVKNAIKVPTEGGHLQGVQLIEKNGIQKLFISGSSHSKAYILQVNLASGKTDRIVYLMEAPFRHAGGIQVSKQYLAVGIEDNFTKTTSKVCIYNYTNVNLYDAKPDITIERTGEAKRKTAGATGLLALENDFLMVVSNWDSRDWDFYHIDSQKNEAQMIARFAVPDQWAAYQSINLIMDANAIYAIGFYKKEQINYADLVLVSNSGAFEPIMEKVLSKTFHCKSGVDFATAAGLQVDQDGDLHLWGTQRDALEQIAINKFSQKK